MNRFALIAILICSFSLTATAQQTESRAALNQPASASDKSGTPAIEASLQTQVLNGADDSPVTNIKMVVKNVSGVFYTYVTGWATFYDAAGVRCGEGLFKVDALAAGESVATDAPGLRLRCSPQSWRIVATNLLTPTADVAKRTEEAPMETAMTETTTPPRNFIITIDGQDYPIQINNPLVLRLGNTNRRIVLKSVK